MYASPRVGPIIVPPPRVEPTGVPSPRVHAQADPQEDESILGVTIFDSFEEEDNSPALLYRTRANARRHAANHVGHTIPIICWPITFTNIAPLAETPISKPTPINYIKKMKEANTEPIEMPLEELFQFAVNIEEASITPGKDYEGNARSSEYTKSNTTIP
jgi:hypothetical protein